MAFSLRVLPIIPTFVLLMIQIASAVDPLVSLCFNTQNFTSNSPYETNLKVLFGDLNIRTPPSGFGQYSSTGQDRAYGLSLCRGDVSRKNCSACVMAASSEILKRCPNNRGAIIWYDNCLLKYSDTDFFGQIDNQNRFYMWNLQNVSDNIVETFNQNTRMLLSNLSGEACGATRMFAYGEAVVAETEKIYGMVQCSRDLSSVDCKKCLDGAVSELPSCCGGKLGGRVVGGSCNIRYEIYPFLYL